MIKSTNTLTAGWIDACLAVKSSYIWRMEMGWGYYFTLNFSEFIGFVTKSGYDFFSLIKE